jgi:hypothetical protein
MYPTGKAQQHYGRESDLEWIFLESTFSMDEGTGCKAKTGCRGGVVFRS